MTSSHTKSGSFDAQAPAVLTIGGQTVSLPRAEHHLDERALDSARALAGLTEALDQIAEAPHHAPRITDVHEDHSGLDAQGHPTKSSSRRGRRNRAASSPAGSASTTAVVQRDQTPDVGAQGVRVEAASIPAKPTTAPKSAASEPMILGVGVPASEL
ncbi:MAG: hypothetical protein HIU81_12730 [Acidobacteria bacterium]|nr:hypothetical protein [Acidobacteriota bacterium]